MRREQTATNEPQSHEVLASSDKKEHCEETEEKDEAEEVHCRDEWIKIFSTSENQQDDIQTFIRQIMTKQSDDLYANEKLMCVDEQIVSRLPFLMPFIQSMRKCYLKGIRQIDDVMFRLKP